MQARRLAMFCDQSGQVQRVIRDDFPVAGLEVEGITLQALVCADSRRSCFEFLAAVRDESAVYGWMLNLRTTADNIASVHIAGVAHDDQILIIACDQAAGLIDYTEELMKINNQHVNELQQLMKRTAVTPSASGDVLGRITDLTNEMTALQRELTKKNEQLRRLLVEKNELVGFAAHDLRNPLCAITVSATMLADRPELPADCREIARAMEAECARMTSLVDEYLSAAAIESGALRLSKDTTELVALVRDIVEKNRVLHPQLRFGFETQVKSLPITLDKLKIGQVLYNLLDNAARHSPSGSEIRVSIGLDGSMAVTAIKDSGPGIPREQWPTMLKKYAQGDPDAEGHGGWGLGLAICHRIATEHGGDIRLSPGGDLGAKVELLVPCDVPQAAATGAP